MNAIISARVFILLLYLFSSFGCMKGSSEYDHGINETDKHFSSSSLQLHQTGSEASALATGRSTDSVIKTHANNSQNFHRQAYHQVDSVTRYINFNVHAATDPAIVLAYQQLLTLQGVPFDSAYLHTQIHYLQKAIDHYTLEIAAGGNVSLVKHASEKLPAIKKELTQTENLFTKYR